MSSRPPPHTGMGVPWGALAGSAGEGAKGQQAAARRVQHPMQPHPQACTLGPFLPLMSLHRPALLPPTRLRVPKVAMI